MFLLGLFVTFVEFPKLAEFCLSRQACYVCVINDVLIRKPSSLSVIMIHRLSGGEHSCASLVTDVKDVFEPCPVSGKQRCSVVWWVDGCFDFILYHSCYV